MAQDVASILRQYESAPDQEPMHGRLGEIRRKPSTDEKRTKRELKRSQAELEEPTVGQKTTASIADLLGQASVAKTDSERQSLMLQVESLRTVAARQGDQGYDPSLAKIADRLVPGAVYERTTADSDWLLGLSTTADLAQASQEMVVESTLWFNSRPDEVKAYAEEFAEQARNKARHVSGRYGDQAEAAEQVFLTEASRLRVNAVKAGLVVEAIDALVQDTLGKMQTGEDVEGLKEMSDGVAEQYRHASLNSMQNTEVLAEIAKEAASTVPQVGSTGIPTDTFSTLNGESALPEGATDSNRAPQLQEMQGYSGFGGSSVVPAEDNHAQADNGDTGGSQDAASPAPGFPVGASKTASLTKESHMTQAHALCPTCSGQGRVAVRQLTPREAYSGLPQIDEIMNNSDTAPEQTPYPAEVAFPVTWNPNTVPSAINQTEQQISERNAKSPLASSAVQHRAMEGMYPGGQNSGRDNSGWIGDMGAKGTDYPGYSTPNYGGPSNLGQPDPVYGEGGDNGNQPLLPYGHQEAADITNNPQQWSVGQPTQGDVGASTVAPTMNTQGQLSQSQKIAYAQAKIRQAQAELAAAYEG